MSLLTAAYARITRIVHAQTATFMVHAKNQLVFNDGQITLYQRDDVQDLTWHMRIRNENKRGYVRRSTGKTDLEQAKIEALTLLGIMKERQAQQIPMRSMNFTELASSFLREAETRMKEQRSSAGRYLIIHGTVTRYLLPYFKKRDPNHFTPQDISHYRTWRMNYYTTGPGVSKKTVLKVHPSPATQRQEWTVFRGIIMHGIEMRMVTPALIHMLKHQPSRTGKRPPFTQQEWRQLYLFMRSWVKSSKTKKGARERQLIRDYTLIMCNSGLRKGEARYLKWRDLRIYENQHGRWALLNVTGKTGERTVVCQPNTERYFNRMQKRGHNLEPNDYIFCHEDGEPIEYVRGFDIMLKDAGMTYDSQGKKRTIYSLRHTYATLRLENGTNVYWLKQNMGTSVNMIERHYGQTRVLVGIEHETARRKKHVVPKPDQAEHRDLPTEINDDLGTVNFDTISAEILAQNYVPEGAVDMTPADLDLDPDYDDDYDDED